MSDPRSLFVLPVEGEWLVLTPPGHGGLAVDLLATDGRSFPA